VAKEGARPMLHQCWSIVFGGFTTSGRFVMLNGLVNKVLFPKYLATEVFPSFSIFNFPLFATLLIVHSSIVSVNFVDFGFFW